MVKAWSAKRFREKQCRQRYGQNAAGKWVRCSAFRWIDYHQADSNYLREFGSFAEAFAFNEKCREDGSGGRNARCTAKPRDGVPEEQLALQQALALSGTGNESGCSVDAGRECRVAADLAPLADDTFEISDSDCSVDILAGQVEAALPLSGKYRTQACCLTKQERRKVDKELLRQTAKSRGSETDVQVPSPCVFGGSKRGSARSSVDHPGSEQGVREPLPCAPRGSKRRSRKRTADAANASPQRVFDHALLVDKAHAWKFFFKVHPYEADNSHNRDDCLKTWELKNWKWKPEENHRNLYICESGHGRMLGRPSKTSCGKCIGHLEFVKCIRLCLDRDTIMSFYNYHRVTLEEFEILFASWKKQDELWAWEFTRATALPASEMFYIEKTTQVQHVWFDACMKIPMDRFLPFQSTFGHVA